MISVTCYKVTGGEGQTGIADYQAAEVAKEAAAWHEEGCKQHPEHGGEI